MSVKWGVGGLPFNKTVSVYICLLVDCFPYNSYDQHAAKNEDGNNNNNLNNNNNKSYSGEATSAGSTTGCSVPGVAKCRGA